MHTHLHVHAPLFIFFLTGRNLATFEIIVNPNITFNKMIKQWFISKVNILHVVTIFCFMITRQFVFHD